MKKLLNILIMLSIAASASASVLTVRPGTEVAGDRVMLGEIADFGDGAGRLENVCVCASPLPGKARIVTKNQIIVAVRRAGIADEEIELRCPDEVKITRKAAVVTGEDLFAAAKDYILENSGLPGRIEIEKSTIPKDVKVPVGEIAFEVKPSFGGIKPGLVSLPIEIKVGGDLWKKTSVGVKVRVFAPVLVASRLIRAGEEFTPDNTRVEEREITASIIDAVTGEFPAGKVTNATISEGTPVRERYLKDPPAIRFRDRVLVIVESGAITITEEGTAMGTGRPGDRIKVRLSDNVRTVRGLIVEEGIVKITQPGKGN